MKSYKGVFSCKTREHGLILLIWQVYLPSCVVINIYREYRVVMTILTLIRIMVTLDYEKDDITANNSLIKLIVGGQG